MTPRDSGDDPKSTPPPAARGPVPVRDLMKPAAPRQEQAPAGHKHPADRVERVFGRNGEEWIARSAGSGAYGTGRTGRAKLVAVHFFRDAEPETPIREALVPAGVFPRLRAEELRELFDRATPIELDR